MLNAAGFPVTSKDRTSILFEDQLDNHFLKILRIVRLFVGLNRMVHFLLRNLFHMFIMLSFVVLLQQNRDVDSLVLEHFLS